MSNDLLMVATEKSLLFFSPRFSKKCQEINQKWANDMSNSHKVNNKSKNFQITKELVQRKDMCPLILTIDFGDQTVVQANLHHR